MSEDFAKELMQAISQVLQSMEGSGDLPRQFMLAGHMKRLNSRLMLTMEAMADSDTLAVIGSKFIHDNPRESRQLSEEEFQALKGAICHSVWSLYIWSDALDDEVTLRVENGQLFAKRQGIEYLMPSFDPQEFRKDFGTNANSEAHPGGDGRTPSDHGPEGEPVRSPGPAGETGSDSTLAGVSGEPTGGAVDSPRGGDGASL